MYLFHVKQLTIVTICPINVNEPYKRTILILIKIILACLLEL